MKTITHNGKVYPEFQEDGFAAKFAFPFAKEVCKGWGYDIGCGRPEWAFPGSMPIDLTIDDEWDANNLPRDKKADYIFSSHCLEHVDNWVDTLDNWRWRLQKGGTLFLYLPDFSQSYWRPWHNRKHRHVFTPEIIRTYLEDRGYENIFVSGIDLNNSFIAMAES
jgi:predicted SAM-dependent methyltransferase